MRTRATFLATLPVLLLLASGAGAQEDPNDMTVIHEAFGAPMVPRPMTAAEPPTPVSLNRMDAFQAGRNAHELAAVTAAEIARVEQRTAAKYGSLDAAPPRIGLRRAIETGPLSVQNGSAMVTELGTFRKLWTMKVRSPGAFGIRLRFTDFDVDESSVLVYASTPAGELIVEGPYTRRGPERDGDFWTPTLPGDEAFVEITGTTEPQFKIEEVIHFDHDLNGEAPESSLDDGPPLLGCHIDVNCHLDWISVHAKNATGRMSWCDSTGSCGACTGTILNDKDDETRVPYFITARHCLSTQAEVDTLEVYWQYETDFCELDGGTPPAYPGTLPKAVGGKLLNTYGENDMTFIRLNDSWGFSFAGWTTDTSSGAYGVHHPKGSYKRAVFLSDVGVCVDNCWCEDATDFDYYEMTDGLTQPGSSGSGAFNWNGQLAGQLKGKCTAYHDSGKELTCGNLDDWTNMYGEFETSYDRISRYLYVGGTMYVDWEAQGIIQNGTKPYPYATVAQAHDGAWDTLQIRIKAGDYPENITMDKALTLVADGGVVTIGE